MKKISSILLIGLCLLCQTTFLFGQHPHLLVKAEDKAAIIEKAKTHPWAATILADMKKAVDPYAERHKTDREWILSRYLMNWTQGKHYTTVYADESGSRLIKWAGNAPFPTVRVNTYLRAPVTEKGSGYVKPTIEELVPYDTARVMLLFNPETGKKEWTDPQAFITSINGDINHLAMQAAILYWLQGDEKYARFAADLLDQWVKGAYYQEPIVGPCRTGFLDLQTLGDQSYRPLILAYDFVKPYMEQKGYDLTRYEKVFEKFASTLAFRGFWNNNWYAAESSTLVFAALSLENKAKKDYYLQFFLSKDTINGACGQLALPSTVEKWLTPDGHWKEPGGYHNYPVGNLLLSSLALEKNGYDIFRQFPALFKASYAMIKYSFPNMTVGGFGDTGRASQSPESLEIGLWGAVKYDHPALPDMLTAMNKLISDDKYKREDSGFLGLLCFLPDLPASVNAFNWPRTGTLEFAKYFLQRNGNDPMTGLMIGVQGATYNHNHCNGMAIELYGLGEVLGIDAGTGPNYEHPLHRNYYSQWAAHNTVVAAGASSSVPFSGSAGAKNSGQIELAAMEPLPDKEAVSAAYSFSDTRYLDKSTATNQSRTLAIIRNSATSGYYVDIHRSDNTLCNDYVYHNIGEGVQFLDGDRRALQTVPSEYPRTEKDYPGFRFFSKVEKLTNDGGNVTVLFPIHDDKQGDLYLQALLPGAPQRSYFKAYSLKTKTSGHHYHDAEIPLFTIHATGEAATKPFVSVFEPYKGAEAFTVRSVNTEKVAHPATGTILQIREKGERERFIFQSTDPEHPLKGQKGSLTGYFGIAGMEAGQLTSLYLGKGRNIQCQGYSLTVPEGESAAELQITAKDLIIHCNSKIVLSIPTRKCGKIFLNTGSETRELSFTRKENKIQIDLPALKSGKIIIP
ncbi:MAG: heparinase II/III-family protein [Marinilabiliales bacterium]|nr:heparinase II/III-family protein [Marinilabiliales bacterium]